MSRLTPQVPPYDPDRDEETYFSEVLHRKAVVHPHAPPEEYDYQKDNPRLSRRFLSFFLHPARVMADNFVFVPYGAQRVVPVIPGEMASWNHRFNIYKPEPGTFGERFEMGAPE